MDRTRDIQLIYGSYQNRSVFQKGMILEEGIKDKINKLERMGSELGMSIPLDDLTKAYLTKRENSIDWESWFSKKTDLDKILKKDIEDTDVLLSKTSDKLQKVVGDMKNYVMNNGYPLTFTALLLRDFTTTFSKQRETFPSFDSVVVAEIYGEAQGNPNFGNLAKLYRKKAKEVSQRELSSKGGGKNEWIFLKGAGEGTGQFGKKMKTQMALSSKKTGWCTGGEWGCKKYAEDDFYLYLDDEGDAIVSLRFEDDKLEEISGTNRDQSLKDNEKKIASDFIFKEKKFTNLNTSGVKSRLSGYINLDKPKGWDKEIVKWARELYKKGGSIKIDLNGNSGDFNYNNPEEVEEIFNYIQLTHPRVTTKDGSVITIRLK